MVTLYVDRRIRILSLTNASGVFAVPEHGLDVASQERDEGGRAEAGRHEVEERRLRVLVEVHDSDGGEEACQE